MPEWSNGAVSKTVDRHPRSEGSNPSLSAIEKGCKSSIYTLFLLLGFRNILSNEFSSNSFAINNGCVDINASLEFFYIDAVA